MYNQLPDKKVPSHVDLRISVLASAFASRIKIADYNPKGLAVYAYYEGMKDEFLSAKEDLRSAMKAGFTAAGNGLFYDDSIFETWYNSHHGKK